ncbi:CFEM domain protein [Cordyceps militaris CM01]|uniref:CFEM domain protein n=1 Tax=Cordyceps militaris (strain CM01) TaxID=983644 RepID=G3JT52_CORMM|nr:CFEM domain protein [Cordyceps militaris CM01]EGX89048.1 CFEM domain protein [Cordyceps militaris CM01]
MALSFAKLAGLVLGAAICTAAADDSFLQKRQLHGLTDQGSSSTSIAAAAIITRAPSSITTQAGPLRWELTTVFTQPDECEGGITQYAGDLSTLGYWLNIPFPAPGLTLTSCFPPALVASATASVDQPPYSQLVCPYRWQVVDFNSTYRVCCPHDYRIYAPAMVSHSTLPDRPGLGAWCTSWVQAGKFAALTIYDKTGGSSVVETTLGESENWLVQATAFDGTVATDVPKTTSSSSTSTPKSTDVTTTTPRSTPTKTTTKTTTTTTTPATTSSAGYSGPTALGALSSCGVILLFLCFFFS